MQKYSPKEIFNSCALQYHEKFMNFDLYNDSFNLFCELVKMKNPSVLEVGCGPGNITKYILNKRPDFNILGIDIASNMIALAKENNPSANFKVMDCKNVLQLKNKFEGVICGFILPYLSKEEVLKLFEDIALLLNPNGILYLSTMEDLYSKSKFIASSIDRNKGLFTYYHKADYLTENLQQKGFKIIHLERKDYPEPKDTSKDLIIIAMKN